MKLGEAGDTERQIERARERQREITYAMNIMVSLFGYRGFTPGFISFLTVTQAVNIIFFIYSNALKRSNRHLKG